MPIAPPQNVWNKALQDYPAWKVLLDAVAGGNPADNMLDMVGPLGMLRRGGAKGIEVASDAIQETAPALFDLNRFRKIVDDPEYFFHGTRSPKPFEYGEGFAPSMTSRYDEMGQMIDSGSGADPSAFMGTHFADEASVANKFAGGNLQTRGYVEGGQGRIIPSKLDLSSPKYFDDDYALQDFIYQQELSGTTISDDFLMEAAEGADEGMEAFFKKYEKDPKFRESVNRDVVSSAEELDDGGEIAQGLTEELADAAVSVLKREGYDGVVYKNVVEGGNAVIVFDPEKILMGIGQ